MKVHEYRNVLSQALSYITYFIPSFTVHFSLSSDMEKMGHRSQVTHSRYQLYEGLELQFKQKPWTF